MAMVVTQELEDIISNPVVKNSIISNSDIICLLDQSKFIDKYQEIANLLSLTEVNQKQIFTINQLPNKENRNRFNEVFIKKRKLWKCIWSRGFSTRIFHIYYRTN